MNRRHVVIASVWSLSLGGAVALFACGGGDDSTSSPGGDSGVASDATTVGTGTATAPTGTSTSAPFDATVGDDDAAVNDGATRDGASDGGPSVDAGTAGITVYAGQIATIDASGLASGNGVSYIWTVKEVPPGSALTSASIVNATSAAASVPTDRSGSYQLSVVATSGAQTLSATFTINAVAAHLIYDVEDQVSGTSGFATIDTDGTNGHALICPFIGSAGDAIDTFEGEGGTATKVVFVGAQQFAGTGLGTREYYRLLLTDTNGSCPTGGDAGDNAFTLFDAGYSAVSSAGFRGLAAPRFSPDGTKVLFTGYMHTGNSANQISQREGFTVNVDGTGLNDLNFANHVSQLHEMGNDQDIRPEWVDNSHVAWADNDFRNAFDGGFTGSWDVFVSSVPIVAGEPTSYMTCVGTAPYRVVVLADGSVLTVTTITSASDLVVYQPNATTKACTLQRNLTNLSHSANSSVEAFALSPDGKTVAFAANDPSRNDAAVSTRFVLYTVPVDGSAVPKRIGSVDQLDAYQGLRWIAGGGQIAFTRISESGGRTVASIPVHIAEAATDLVAGDGGVTLTAASSADTTND